MGDTTGRTWHRALILLVVLFTLAGCASTPDWPEQPADGPQASARNDRGDLSESFESGVELDHVPFHAQERYQCGPASLSMMLNTQGVDTNPELLKEQVYLPGRTGSLQVELVASARRHDMVAYRLEPELQAILTEVAAGHPVLVMQNLRFGWWPQWHFAVVIGFDPVERRLILHTDTREAHRETVEVFMATWERADRWAMVMLPPKRLPATAQPLDYLRSVNDLETTGRFEAASTAYQRAHQAWPDQPAALLGEGNIAYRQQNWQQAADAFRRLTEHFPELAPGWNNLAHALGHLGCPLAAEQAAGEAARLDPDRFGEIDPLPINASGAGQCPMPDNLNL